MTDTEQMAVDLMKAKYFELAKKENYPHTKELTAELDKLEAAIRTIQGK